MRSVSEGAKTHTVSVFISGNDNPGCMESTDQTTATDDTDMEKIPTISLRFLPEPRVITEAKGRFSDLRRGLRLPPCGVAFRRRPLPALTAAGTVPDFHRIPF
jgi:hypothetical protein